MRKLPAFIVALGVLGLCVPAMAGTIRFTATGSPSVSGYVDFDASVFDGSTGQFVPNTNITDLSLNVAGFLFALPDVVTSDDTVIDSSGVPALVKNGVGALAFNGAQTIAFFPDGFGGTATDGDASLTLDTDGSYTFGGTGWENTYAVQWSATAVPLPSAAWLGLALLGGLGVVRRRRRRALAE